MVMQVTRKIEISSNPAPTLHISFFDYLGERKGLSVMPP